MDKDGQLKEGSPCCCCGAPAVVVRGRLAYCEAHQDDDVEVLAPEPVDGLTGGTEKGT
jgi:hypothetical protein